MRRLRRWTWNGLLALSLAAWLATAAMWVRSFRALDQWNGTVGGVYFEVNSYAGRCEATTHRRYQLRTGVAPDVDVLRADRPFDLLEEATDVTPADDNFVARQRWPLGDTDKWEPGATFFPGVHGSRWLAWGREGPGRYTWVTECQVPYWLLLVAFSLVPVAFVLGPWGRRRAGSNRRGHCPSCGYDLRASPERCPECGAVPAGG